MANWNEDESGRNPIGCIALILVGAATMGIVIAIVMLIGG